MSSFNDYLTKIQELTDKNLQILSLINESFYSRKTKASALIDGVSYTIPSFITIENKINDLEGNWNKLIAAPDAGSAAFVLDGTTRRILLSGFETAPEAMTTLKQDEKDRFYVESNDILKDFISPLVYLKFDLNDLPLSVRNVNVRKVSFKNRDITLPTAGATDWATISSIFENWTEDTDYVMYDKIYSLPLRVNDYDGTFTATDITTRQDGSYLYWDLTLDGYTYTYENGTMTGDLKVNDKLLSKDGECKFTVTAIDYNSKKVTLKVDSGYADPKNGITLRYFKAAKDIDRFIKVPLEEDQHIAIFIAPVNDTVNCCASWDAGVLIDTDTLTDSTGRTFKEVYGSEIKNLGDIIFDLTQFIDSSISSLSEAEVTKITNYKPVLNTDTENGDYSVVMLNDHLLDNTSVDQIRKLNVEKTNISADLKTLQDQVNELTTLLSATDLSSQSATVRTGYETRLKSLNSSVVAKTKEYINKINEISTLAGDSVLPTSSAKYVIKGAVNTDSIESDLDGKAKVIRLELLYRYKNINKSSSNSTTISDTVTVSDWNKYIIDYRHKTAGWDSDKMKMDYDFEPSGTGTGNTIAADWRSFSIPITQGETVDIRFRVQYDLGWPYVSVFSAYSDTVNVQFPDDLLQYTDIDTILEDNKTDARDSVVTQELINNGVTDHINDKVIDQDLTYFHRPESISSGFYTEDSRRVISLKDKLYTLNNDIETIKSGVFGGTTKYLQVSLNDDYSNVIVTPNSSNNNFNTINYTDMLEDTEGASLIRYVVNVNITNTSTAYPISLYSMFYGDTQVMLDSNKNATKFDASDYCKGVSPFIDANGSENPQLLSQYLYVRNKNKWTGAMSYTYGTIGGSHTSYIWFNPHTMSDIQLSSSTPGSYYQLGPGDSITLPILIKLPGSGVSASNTSVNIFHLGFDLWTSPFTDPLTYDFDITVNYNSGNSKKEFIAGNGQIYHQVSGSATYSGTATSSGIVIG